MPGSFTDKKYDVKKKTLNVKKANIVAFFNKTLRDKRKNLFKLAFYINLSSFFI